MEKPAFVFDGRNIVNVTKLQNIGFHVETIGRQLNAPKLNGIHQLSSNEIEY